MLTRKNGKCNISIEFRDSNYEDMLLHPTIIVVKGEMTGKYNFMAWKDE